MGASCRAQYRQINRNSMKTVCRQANSEFKQQGGRKKRAAKRSSVTNVTGLLLACFVVILIHLTLMFSGLLKKDQFKGK